MGWNELLIWVPAGVLMGLGILNIFPFQGKLLREYWAPSATFISLGLVFFFLQKTKTEEKKESLREQLRRFKTYLWDKIMPPEPDRAARRASYYTLGASVVVVIIASCALFIAIQTLGVAIQAFNQQQQQIINYRNAILTSTQVKLNVNLDQIAILEENQDDYIFGSSVASANLQGNFLESAANTDIADVRLLELLALIDAGVSNINGQFELDREIMMRLDIDREKAKKHVASIYIAKAGNLKDVVWKAKDRIREIYGIDVSYEKGKYIRHAVIVWE